MFSHQIHILMPNQNADKSSVTGFYIFRSPICVQMLTHLRIQLLTIEFDSLQYRYTMTLLITITLRRDVSIAYTTEKRLPVAHFFNPSEIKIYLFQTGIMPLCMNQEKFMDKTFIRAEENNC